MGYKEKIVEILKSVVRYYSMGKVTAEDNIFLEKIIVPKILASMPSEAEIAMNMIGKYLDYLRDEKGIMIIPEEDCIKIRSIRDWLSTLDSKEEHDANK